MTILQQNLWMIRTWTFVEKINFASSEKIKKEKCIYFHRIDKKP